MSGGSKEFAKSAAGAVAQVGHDALGTGVGNGMAASTKVVENSVEATKEIKAGLQVASMELLTPQGANKVVNGSLDTVTLGLSGRSPGEMMGKARDGCTPTPVKARPRGTIQRPGAIRTYNLLYLWNTN